MNKIDIFDTTLRDGAQSANVSFSVEDKVKVAKILDDFGVTYVEGGWPGANPTDRLFFARMAEIELRNSKLTAFGSTRKKNTKASADSNLQEIIKSGVKTACIFGKAWDLHVRCALNTTNKENLRMIYDSISFLKSKKIEVIFDAEHYFDGFKNNKDYAFEVIATVQKANADIVCLCETNGSILPSEMQTIVKATILTFPGVKFGIHAHNDADCAVANSIIAVEEGCVFVQGTINGIGERCGNANICSIIPALQIKNNFTCIPSKNISKLTDVSRYIYEIINLVPNDDLPYVGRNAFAHKAGIHASAVAKLQKTYEHIDPASVGNERKILISDMSGKSNICVKIKGFDGFEESDNAVSSKKVMEAVKAMENKGYQYENADASFFVLAKKVLYKNKSTFFSLKNYDVRIEKDFSGKITSTATIKLDINGNEEYTVAEGEGPVNALDNCLRKSLIRHYPEIKNIRLTDFKVRVINSDANTAAKVRVLIETSDSKKIWGTVGVGENIIDASWQALVDSIEYKLFILNQVQK
ncbi:MAG: citramalate synthase [Elusimicrobiota bacterium]|jgi:2-isopropylmalate synthase|nr:citramalate synthase [Elusimicrobiota bacterium]